MKKHSKKKSTESTFKVKTGTIEEFFSKAKKVMQAADRAEPIEESHTLIFEDPSELLHFLSAAKLKLIHCIRKHPGSITNIVKFLHRNRAAVYRDINELDKVGIIRVYKQINPGHGHQKMVEVTAKKLKLEASI